MENEKKIVICRCEDVLQSEIEEAIDAGCTTLDEIKKQLRCGMGPCQGRTCGRLISQLICQRTGKPMSEIVPPTARPPAKPTPLGVFAHDKREDAPKRRTRRKGGRAEKEAK